MNVLVCDDDPTTSAALTALAEGHGWTVIAETDSAGPTIDLIYRFHPDAVVLDLALRFGAGADVIEAARTMEDPCPIVVFTSFGHQVDARPPVVAVVDKPDFDGVERALAAIAHTRDAPLERRAWVGWAPTRNRPASAVEDPPDQFYAALSEARLNDALLVLHPADPARLRDLAVLVRDVVRAQDWMLIQPSRLVVLLVGGNPAALRAVQSRLTMIDEFGCAIAETLIGDGEVPADAMLRATAALAG